MFIVKLRFAELNLVFLFFLAHCHSFGVVQQVWAAISLTLEHTVSVDLCLFGTVSDRLRMTQS